MIAFPGYEFLNFQTQPKFMQEYNINNIDNMGAALSRNKFEDNNFFDSSAAKLLQTNNSASFGGLKTNASNNNFY